MEINVDDGSRIVEIWLTKAEKNDPQLRAGLQDIYAEWKKKNYLVAVYESGEKDLYQGTLDLLAWNKKRMAELEVRREREANSDKPSVREQLQALRAQSRPAGLNTRAKPER